MGVDVLVHTWAISKLRHTAFDLQLLIGGRPHSVAIIRLLNQVFQRLSRPYSVSGRSHAPNRQAVCCELHSGTCIVTQEAKAD